MLVKRLFVMVSSNHFVKDGEASQLVKSAWAVNQSGSKKICVHKFGGSSLACAKRIGNVAKLIAKFTEPNDFIVVSANGDVTDWLTQLVIGNNHSLELIEDYYYTLAAELLNKPNDFLANFDSCLEKLRSLSVKELTESQRAQVVALGECWSAQLLVAYLEQTKVNSILVDSQQLLRTSCADDYQCFDHRYFTQQLSRLNFGNFNNRFVMTGFVVSDTEGKALLLGRNGSDFSATLLARFLPAEQVTLWTDVKGIYHADPNIINNAQVIKQLCYEEAQALASLGTNVLHQKTIAPLIETKIPLRVRSSIATENSAGNGDVQGTLIAQYKSKDRENSVGKSNQLSYTAQTNKPLSQIFKTAIKSIAIKSNKIILVGKGINTPGDFLLSLKKIINEINLQSSPEVKFSIQTFKARASGNSIKHNYTSDYLLYISNSLQSQQTVTKAKPTLSSQRGLSLQKPFALAHNLPLLKLAQLLSDLLIGEFDSLSDLNLSQTDLTTGKTKQTSLRDAEALIVTQPILASAGSL
jgi:aspartate kinase